MTDLVRRALLGDREAQKECTAQGIALPCPFCEGNSVKVDSKEGPRLGRNGLDMPVYHYTFSARCTKCHARGLTVGGKVLRGYSTRLLPGGKLPEWASTRGELEYKALAAWNTRAPVPTAEQIERLEANDVPERSD